MNMPQTTPHLIDNYQARVDLAAAFRWTARLNMHESIANHFSCAVSDDGSQFLVNPNGRHFSQIKASELILVDGNDARTLERPDAPDITAWALHSEIHKRSVNARCVLHVHSKYATALACLQDSSLPPIDQNSMRFFERLAIDEGFDGMGLGDEAKRVSHCLGDKPVLLMGNHGVITVGATVAQAFDDLYYFERACETYLTALATGKPLRVASDAVARKTMRQWVHDYDGFAERHLSELKLILDKEEPDYKR